MPSTEASEDRVAAKNNYFRRFGRGVASSFSLPEAEGRDIRIDAMKGLAIILVVLAHAILIYDPHLKDSLARLIINSFHMPLFFFLSGYVAFASARKYSSRKLLSKRFQNLVMPFLSWYFIVGAAWTLLFRNTGFREYSWSLVENPFAGRWFLLVLFWCFVLLVLANRLAGHLKLFAYLLVLFVPTVIPLVLGMRISTAFLGLGMLARVLVFFFAGYLFFRYKDRITIAMRCHPALRSSAITACLLGFPLLIVIGLLIGRSPGPIFYFYMGTPASPFDPGHILAVAVAFLGIAWVYCAFELVSRGSIRWLAWIGNYTLDILVIHMAASYFILRVLAAPLATTGIVGRIGAILLITACAILFSLFISIFILRRSKTLAFLFLGRPFARPSNATPDVPAWQQAQMDGADAIVRKTA